MIKIQLQSVGNEKKLRCDPVEIGKYLLQPTFNSHLFILFIKQNPTNMLFMLSGLTCSLATSSHIPSRPIYIIYGPIKHPLNILVAHIALSRH
jgi:hypothetical protein